ncbi:acylneuraminate cytidylyltransferase family protein [Polynucleobacter paneuropaeus]|nr:acylneuraminate cytidylyltransferase family protein [Polynucleobacter paneuropaeus]
MILSKNTTPRVLAVIPARGGSKGISRKNLTAFAGIPLVANSIRHGLESEFVNRVLVSTDDLEIQQVALEFGAEAPFLRPKELAGDDVLDLPVFVHALNFLLEAEGYVPDYVVHLRPTAPYRAKGWIDNALHLLIKNPGADSIRSVSEPDKHPYRMFTVDGEGYLDPIMKHEHPTPFLLRRQDLPKIYYYNCVIDITSPRTIYTQKSMTGNRILPFILESNEVIDIDTPRDLEIARFIFEGKE